MTEFIDRHRDAYGVEPICKVLRIAPSGHWRHAAQQRAPRRLPARAQRDAVLMPEIQRVWHADEQVYGADKVWRQLNREGIQVARGAVERLMKRLGLAGVRRGKVVRTRRPTTPPRARWIGSTGNSRQIVPISGGCRTSPTS